MALYQTVADDDSGLNKCSAEANAVLVVAHPGHELRVYGWLKQARPLVCVLTDGSGSSGASRLASTAGLLARVGAMPGGIFGRFSDRGIYEALLEQNFGAFLKLTDELTELFARNHVTCVIGDAAEGYNPAHDVCRYLINAAVRRARKDRAHPLANFDFLLTGEPIADLDARRDGDVLLRLDEETFQEKVAAAKGYGELADEVERTFGELGSRAFQNEWLRAVDFCPGEGVNQDGFSEPPYYEKYGESRVAAGIYSQVLRYREHVLPLIAALGEHSSSPATRDASSDHQ